MLEADRVELFFGDRPCDNRHGGAGAGKPNGELERIQGTMSSRHAGMAGRIRMAGVKLDER
jgi:hypothetical protein